MGVWENGGVGAWGRGSMGEKSWYRGNHAYGVTSGCWDVGEGIKRIA
jgi:hypothetical protein